MRSLRPYCLALVAAFGFVVMSCGAGGAGGSSGACASGFQDEDGNGVCAPVCATAPWWDLDYAYRFALDVSNPNDVEIAAGQRALATIDHASLVSLGLALASGDDLRIVYFDGVANIELGRDSGGWNTPLAEIIFGLSAGLDALAVGETGYWVYYGNPAAVGPPRATPNVTWAYRADDDSKELKCSQTAAAFYSLQLRQIEVERFEVYIRDRAGGTDAYATIKITDDLTGNVIKETTYGDYGTFQNPGYHIEPVTITARRFTVFIESMEFSSSSRVFGCDVHTSSNPPLRNVGSNTFSYIQIFDAVAEPCGL